MEAKSFILIYWMLDNLDDPKDVAREAYGIADAMIKERGTSND